MYLFSLLKKHKIWKDARLWMKLIDSVLDLKVKESRTAAEQRRKRMIERESARRESTKKGNLYEEEYKKNVRVSVIGVLQQFIFFMANYEIDMEDRKGIVMKYGKEYSLDPKEIFEMLKELQIPQEIKVEAESKKARMLKRHKKLVSSCNGNCTFTALILSTPYMDSEELRSMLVLSKEGYATMKSHIFRHVLLSRSIPVSCHFQIWSQILNLVPLLLT